MDRILDYAARFCNLDLPHDHPHPTPFIGEMHHLNHDEVPEQVWHGRHQRLYDTAESIHSDDMDRDDLEEPQPRSPMATGYVDTLVPPDAQLDPRSEVAERIFACMERMRIVCERATVSSDTLMQHRLTDTYGKMMNGFAEEYGQSMSLFQGHLEDARRQELSLFQIMKIEELAIKMTDDIEKSWDTYSKKVESLYLTDDDNLSMTKDMSGDMERDDQQLDDLEADLFKKRRRLAMKQQDKAGVFFMKPKTKRKPMAKSSASSSHQPHPEVPTTPPAVDCD